MTKHLDYLLQLRLYLLHRVQLADIWQLHRLPLHIVQFHMLLYMLFAEIEFFFHGYFQLYLSCIAYTLQILLLLHIFQQFQKYYSLDLDNPMQSPTEEDYSFHLIFSLLCYQVLLTSDYRSVQGLKLLYFLLEHNDRLLLFYHLSILPLQHYKYRYQSSAKQLFYMLIQHCNIRHHMPTDKHQHLFHQLYNEHQQAYLYNLHSYQLQYHLLYTFQLHMLYTSFLPF